MQQVCVAVMANRGGTRISDSPLLRGDCKGLEHVRLRRPSRIPGLYPEAKWMPGLAGVTAERARGFAEMHDCGGSEPRSSRSRAKVPTFVFLSLRFHLCTLRASSEIGHIWHN